MKKHISVDEGLGLLYGNNQTRIALREQIASRQIEVVVERTEEFLKTKKILDARLHTSRMEAAEASFWDHLR